MSVKARSTRADRQMRLWAEVMKQFYDCGDQGVMMYFDPDSDKNLEKKYRVLKAINAGKNVSDADVLAILEKLPRDENGDPTVSDW